MWVYFDVLLICSTEEYWVSLVYFQCDKYLLVQVDCSKAKFRGPLSECVIQLLFNVYKRTAKWVPHSVILNARARVFGTKKEQHCIAVQKVQGCGQSTNFFALKPLLNPTGTFSHGSWGAEMNYSPGEQKTSFSAAAPWVTSFRVTFVPFFVPRWWRMNHVRARGPFALHQH